MANATIAINNPLGASVPWYNSPTLAKVTATFNSTSYNTANNVGILVDLSPLFASSQSGTSNVYGATTQVLDQPWGLNTGDAIDIIAAIGTSANTWGLSLGGSFTVSGQPTQRTIVLAAANNAANAANGSTGGYVEFAGSALTGTMQLWVIFAKGVRSFTSPGTGA
jgi:hypothetical protein